MDRRRFLSILAGSIAAQALPAHAAPAAIGTCLSGNPSANAVPSPTAWTCSSVVCDGDSMVSGSGGAGTSSAWPTWLQARLPGSSSNIFNIGVGGRTVQDVQDAFASEAAPHLSAGSIFIYYCGNNDFGIRTAAQIYATAQTTWAAARASGAKVIVILNLPDPSKDASTAWDIGRLAYRTLVLSDATKYDGVINADNFFPVGALFFDGDDAHLSNPLGAQTMARVVYNFVNKSGLLP